MGWRNWIGSGRSDEELFRRKRADEQPNTEGLKAVQSCGHFSCSTCDDPQVGREKADWMGGMPQVDE